MRFLMANLSTAYTIMMIVAGIVFMLIVFQKQIGARLEQIIRTIIVLIGIGAFIAGALYCSHEYRFYPALGLLFSIAGLVVPFKLTAKKIVCSLAGFNWDLNDFCRGWLITGRTGSGKTAAAIHQIMHQLFQKCPNWGGMAVDPKGDFHEIVTEMAEHYGVSDKLITIRVKPRDANADWKPEIKYNLLSYPGITRSTYAGLIVDTAAAVQPGDKGFFKTQAQIFIEAAMVMLDVIKVTQEAQVFWDWSVDYLDNEQREQIKSIPSHVSMKTIYDLLTERPRLTELIKTMQTFLVYVKKGTRAVQNDKTINDKYIKDLQSIIITMNEKYLSQPEEQLGGVMSTIFNYLQFFTEEDVAEVFCAPEEENATDFQNIDRGKIFTLVLPQKYKVQRVYVSTFMKLLFYTHAMDRFDKTREEQNKCNLLVFWADEAQNVITDSGGGMADYNVIDKIRAIKATVVFAAQSMASFTPVLGKDKTNVLLLNLSNQVFFTEPNSDAAKTAAELIGKQEITKRTHSTSSGKTNYSYRKEEEFIVKPFELMGLKKFWCILRHCEGKHKKTKIAPVTTDGKRPSWYGWWNF